MTRLTDFWSQRKHFKGWKITANLSLCAVKQQSMKYTYNDKSQQIYTYNVYANILNQQGDQLYF